MKPLLLPIVATIAVLSPSLLRSDEAPRVVLETTMGDIVLELNVEKAPVTTANFLQYVDDGFYDGIVFHRVIEDFMVQTGGFALLESGSIEQKETRETIQNEAKNGLRNERGTIAMARTRDPHSASAQFFINHSDNGNLDYPSFDGWGYAVFGKVVAGMDVVDAIAAVETAPKMMRTRAGGQVMERSMDDVPVENIVIVKAKRVEAD